MWREKKIKNRLNNINLTFLLANLKIIFFHHLKVNKSVWFILRKLTGYFPLLAKLAKFIAVNQKVSRRNFWFSDFLTFHLRWSANHSFIFSFRCSQTHVICAIIYIITHHVSRNSTGNSKTLYIIHKAALQIAQSDFLSSRHLQNLIDLMIVTIYSFVHYKE